MHNDSNSFNSQLNYNDQFPSYETMTQGSFCDLFLCTVVLSHLEQKKLGGRAIQ